MLNDEIILCNIIIFLIHTQLCNAYNAIEEMLLEFFYFSHFFFIMITLNSTVFNVAKVHNLDQTLINRYLSIHTLTRHLALKLVMILNRNGAPTDGVQPVLSICDATTKTAKRKFIRKNCDTITHSTATASLFETAFCYLFFFLFSLFVVFLLRRGIDCIRVNRFTFVIQLVLIPM